MPEPIPEQQLALRREVERMVDEVPLYQGRARPGADLSVWMAAQPLIGKRELRRGFPKTLLRRGQDLSAAMNDGLVTLLATSGTTADRLQVLWEWSWWDPQEREAMRLNARIATALAREGYSEAVLTTPACGAGSCHIGNQTRAERTIDGMLFFNQSPDPSYWTPAECERMLGEWRDFAPRGIEADPAYLAALCRFARARGIALPSPEFVTLTYESTTRAQRREIARVIDAPLYQLYGATEAGALFMECERGLLHANTRHSHVELLPLDGRLARVVVTTLGREWMPLLRYEIGDVARLASVDACACGLPARGPLLERIEGRFSDCVKAGERVISPLMLDDAISAAAPEHVQWQLAGELLSVIGPSSADAARAAEAASALLGRRVRGEATAAIAPEASGKYRLVRA